MNCKHCNVPMVQGHALSHDYRCRFGWRVGTLVLFALGSFGGLRACLKCPKCGYSKSSVETA
jgi:hypothetical protein